MFWVCLLVFGFFLNWSMVLAADAYVESSGSCGGKTPCYSTIQAAINAANSGDTIKLAQGIYPETIVLDSDKQLILQGGWDSGFTNQTQGTTAIRAPIVTKGAIAFQELRIMEIAGPMGNAIIADVLDGKTFSSDAGTGFIGIMPNRGVMSYTPTTTDQTIVAGYYNGSGKVVGDSNLVTGNIRSGATIFGVAGDTNVVNTSSGDAVAGEILKDKKAWVAGSEVTGTLATQTLSPDSTTVAAGNYAATTLNAVDPDLATGNIKRGVTIFGVAGKTEVVDTTEATNPVAETRMKTGDVGFVNGSKITGSGTQMLSSANDSVAEGYYVATTLSAVDTDLVASNIRCGKTIFGVSGAILPACAAKTGQTSCYDTSGVGIDCTGTGQDGEYQKGCDPVVAPLNVAHFGNYNRTSLLCSAGFTDNGDGTVTDNLTGLIWLMNANCDGNKPWEDALTWCKALASGSCDLSDGSSPGDWRLPNINELSTLFDPTLEPPYLPDGHLFTDVRLGYWSSTTYAISTSWAWLVTRGRAQCTATLRPVATTTTCGRFGGGNRAIGALMLWAI